MIDRRNGHQRDQCGTERAEKQEDNDDDDDRRLRQGDDDFVDGCLDELGRIVGDSCIQARGEGRFSFSPVRRYQFDGG